MAGSLAAAAAAIAAAVVVVVVVVAAAVAVAVVVVAVCWHIVVPVSDWSCVFTIRAYDDQVVKA